MKIVNVFFKVFKYELQDYQYIKVRLFIFVYKKVIRI